MTAATSQSNRRNAITNVLTAKINRVHLVSVLKDQKIDVETGEDATDEQLAIVAYAHFDKNTPKEDQCECDVCGGISTVKLDACPYCGTVEGDSATSSKTEINASEMPAEVVSPPKPSTTKKESKKMATTSTGLATTKKDKANGANGAALATPADTKALDSAVKDIRALQQDGAAAYWRLGRRVLDVYKDQLWKQRVGEDGKQSFKTFEKFCNEELDFTPNHAFAMMDVAQHFSEDQVRQFGATKLALVVQAPENKQEKLVEAIEKGATVREVKAEVTAIKKKTGHRRETREGSKAKNRDTTAASKAKSEKATKAKKEVTISKLTGRHTIKLFCKPSSKKYEEKDLKPAKKLGDNPWGKLELVNGVTQEFFVQTGADGSIKLVIVTERAQD